MAHLRVGAAVRGRMGSRVRLRDGRRDAHAGGPVAVARARCCGCSSLVLLLRGLASVLEPREPAAVVAGAAAGGGGVAGR